VSKIGKIIYSTKLARRLIKEGYRIIDVKPNKNNLDRTVFIFEYTPGLIAVLDQYRASQT
jgi:predicted CoA-binding protein